MPTYLVTAPSGKKLKITGEAPPSKQQLDAIFAKLESRQAETDVSIETARLQDESLKQLASEQSGLDTALISAGKGFADILRGVGLMDEADETEKKAYEALKKARPITATVGEVVGQAAPFAAVGGPLVAGVAGTGGRVAASSALGALEGGIVAKGQGEDVTEGALTGAAFGAGGQAIGEAIDAARRISSVAPANAAVEYAAKNNLPLLTTDVVEPKTALGRGVRNIGEQVPFIGTSGIKSAQQSARVGEIDNLKNAYHEISDDEIYKSLTSAKSKYKQVVADRYNSIGAQMGDAEIPIDGTVSAIQNEIKALTRGGVIQDKDTISKLQNVLNDISSGPQTYQQMRDNRTFVREALKSENPSTQADRVVNRVYDAMTNDITRAVASKAGDDAARKLKQVDQLFASEVRTQKKTKLKNIFEKGDIKPEEATKALFSTDVSDVKAVYGALDNAGRAKARAAIVNKFIQSAGENTSPEKFVSAMNRYEKQFDVFFKGAEKKQLEGLKAYLNATRRAGQAQLDPQTGQKLIPWLSIGGVADFSTTGGVATGLTASIAGLSRAYESKPVRQAMIRLANTPKGGEAYQKAVNAVNSAMVAAQQQSEVGDD